MSLTFFFVKLIEQTIKNEGMRDKNLEKLHLKFSTAFPDVLRVLLIIIREITRAKKSKCYFKKALAQFEIIHIFVALI